MESIQSGTLGYLSSFLSLKDILAIATSNTQFRENFLKKEVNDTLAIKLGFPFGLSFNELKE